MLPLQLASSEDFTDYVINAIAVLFIVELDNLDPVKIFRHASSYLLITKEPAIRIRMGIQVMEKSVPDPGSPFLPTKDAALYMTFSTGSVSTVLEMLRVSLYQKNTRDNYVSVTEETCIRFPLQLLGPSNDMKNRDPRRRFESTKSAAFMVIIVPDTDPRFALYKMNVENPTGIRNKIKSKIRNALEVAMAREFGSRQNCWSWIVMIRIQRKEVLKKQKELLYTSIQIPTIFR